MCKKFSDEDEDHYEINDVYLTNEMFTSQQVFIRLALF